MTDRFRCIACYGEEPDCEFCVGGWIDESDMPARVIDHRSAWGSPPDQPSPRLAFWLDRVAAGTCPDFPGAGYDSAAELAGITIWEEIQVLWPALSGAGHARPSTIRAWLDAHSIRSDLITDMVNVAVHGHGWVGMTEAEATVHYREHPLDGRAAEWT